MVKISKTVFSVMCYTTVFFASNIQATHTPKWDKIALNWNMYQSKDSVDIEPAGLGISFSKLVTDHVYVHAIYAQLNDSVDSIDYEFDDAAIGLGVRYSAANTADVYGELSYEYLNLEAQLDNQSAELDSEGFSVKVGLLARWFVESEFDFFMQRFDADETVNVKGVSYNYYASRYWQLNINYAESDTERNYSAGLSFLF